MLISRNKSNKNNHLISRSHQIFRDTLLKRVKFNSSKLVHSISKGEYISLFKSNGLEYAESRTYMFGDDARYIDWTVSSRHNSLYTKYFHEDTNRLVWFLFDSSGSMQIGTPQSLYEIGMETILIFIHLALYQKNKVGGLLFLDKILTYVRPSNTYDMLNTFTHTMLENQYLSGKSDLREAMSFTCNMLTQRGLVVIVSDFLMNDVFSQIQKISKIHDVLLIRIIYNAKKMLPKEGIIRISDSESEEKGILNLSHIRVKLGVEQLEMDRQWALFCSRNYIANTTIDNVNVILPRLFSLFKSSKMR